MVRLIKVSTSIGKFIEREQKAAEETVELSREWAGSPIMVNFKVARRLLSDLAELDEEMTQIIKGAPVTALQNAPFGWACYEVRNAQINLVFLIQFSINHAQSAPAIYSSVVAKERVEPTAEDDLTEEEFAALSDCVGLVHSRIAPSFETYGGIQVLSAVGQGEKALDKLQRAFGLQGDLAETRVTDETGEEP